jgi:hypothetical protein
VKEIAGVLLKAGAKLAWRADQRFIRVYDASWLFLLQEAAREHAGDEIGWLAVSYSMRRNVGRE